MGNTDKVIRCDCGFEAQGVDPAGLVAAAIVHGRDAHGMEFAPADLLEMVVAADRDGSETNQPRGIGQGRESR